MTEWEDNRVTPQISTCWRAIARAMQRGRCAASILRQLRARAKRLRTSRKDSSRIVQSTPRGRTPSFVPGMLPRSPPLASP